MYHRFILVCALRAIIIRSISVFGLSLLGLSPLLLSRGGGGGRAALLDLLPAEAAGGKEGGAGAGDRDVVGVAQAVHVGGQDGGEVARGADAVEHAGDLGGAAVDEQLGRQARHRALDLLRQPVLEDGLGHGDEDGAAHRLEELHARRRLRDPLVRHAVLYH